jgi:N-acetyltransferase 10
VKLLTADRYEIAGDGPQWADADKTALAAAKAGKKNIVVSVKSTKLKRKPTETAAEIYEQEMGDKPHKKSKKGKKERS